MKTCKDCAHFGKIEGHIVGQGLGQCRRYPPTLLAIPMGSPMAGRMEMQMRGDYPPVNEKNAACGEFRFAMTVRESPQDVSDMD